MDLPPASLPMTIVHDFAPSALTSARNLLLFSLKKADSVLVVIVVDDDDEEEKGLLLRKGEVRTRSVDGR